MANRAYLYNIDFNRLERSKTPEDSILSVSEYVYSVPLAYKILLSAYTLNVGTIIWNYEHPISISGNAKEGKIRLFNFLDELQALNLYEKDYLTSEIEKTERFFAENKCDLEYFFFEGGELYEMQDEPVEEQNLAIFNEVANIEKTIDIFTKKVISLNEEIKDLTVQQEEITKRTLFKKSTPILSEDERTKIRRVIDGKQSEKRALLGIDNWSTVLYYQFDEK